jgi:hypothetical protein
MGGGSEVGSFRSDVFAAFPRNFVRHAHGRQQDPTSEFSDPFGGGKGWISPIFFQLGSFFLRRDNALKGLTIQHANEFV